MILVTGGTGLVGSHLLLNLIKSGEKVRATYRKNSDFTGIKRVFYYEHPEKEAEILLAKIDWIEADITNIPALEKAFLGISHVFHCAALVSFDPSQYKNLRKSNIVGTANVANLCIKNKIKKLCFVSSIATFDKKLEENTISETSHWNKESSHSIYAITKYGAEIEVWRASQEGIPVIILNPGVIIGPGFWNSGSGLMFKKISHSLKYHFPKVTGFIGVYDVVKALRQSMDSQIENEQFILVSENLNFENVLEKVAASINKPKPSKKLQAWMVFLGWIFQKIVCSITKKERRFTRHAIKSLFGKSYYSNRKIKTQLNFEFQDLDSVIAKTGKRFKEDFN